MDKVGVEYGFGPFATKVEALAYVDQLIADARERNLHLKWYIETEEVTFVQYMYLEK